MSTSHVHINRLTWVRLVESIKEFTASEVGWKAKMLFALLITLSLWINGLNVVNSYVGRDFMTAIANRNMAGFIWQAIVYIGVFAACTVVAVFFRFTEESLGLLWREWLVKRLVNVYLDYKTYYRLYASGELANPDQRIAEDVRAFTVTTLSFVLMLLNASFTVVAFSGVMWSISPLLFMVTVLYAACGSILTIILGRPLVRLNYDQLDKEANFRTDLIHVRENAESVAMLDREGQLRARLMRHIEEFAGNFRRIIAVNRNLGFFTTGYNYLIQIVPALIVAPLFILEEIEFGVISQSVMAFTHLIGAFSLIVTQFQSISSFTAVIARLNLLVEAIEKAHSPTASAIEVGEAEGRLVYEKLTLRSPRDGRPLVKELSVSISPGTRLLIMAPNDTTKVALFRATAGIWDNGEGRIIRPQLGDILFLPERPYLPPGTLRQVLVRAGLKDVISDDQVLAVLHALDLEPVLVRASGLNAEKDWDDILSLSEQQLLAFTRPLLAAPQFVFLDRPGTALGPEQVTRILKMLSERSITYLTLGDADDQLEDYDAVLEIMDDGRWKWKQIQAGKIKDH